MTAAAREQHQQRQQRLLGLLVCPRCHGPLDHRDVRTAHGLVWDARLLCAACDALVGVVADTKPSFLPRDFCGGRRSGFRRSVLDGVEQDGSWSRVPEGLLSGGVAGDRLRLACTCDAARITFLGHPWSGTVEVRADGRSVEQRDLYSPGTDEVVVDIAFDAMARHEIEIVPTGRRRPAAAAAQVVVKRIDAWTDDGEPPTFTAVDRGNPYPPRFVELLGAARADAIVLDCGGGDRQIGDVRLFNLEYLPYEAPDLYADGLHLPFRDDTFDLILSQAVLEHVTEPQAAVDELRRVLAPTGTVYAEIAFTQPLHAVPSHYFNVTPHGAEHLFRDWGSVSIGWFGGVADTVDWWARLVGIDSAWSAEDRAALRTLLDRFDADVSYDDLRYFASAVAVTAQKSTTQQLSMNQEATTRSSPTA